MKQYSGMIAAIVMIAALLSNPVISQAERNSYKQYRRVDVEREILYEGEDERSLIATDEFAFEKPKYEIECQITQPICSCSGGDSSPDCDQLFLACDLQGGLYSCDVDYREDGDNCYCEF